MMKPAQIRGLVVVTAILGVAAVWVSLRDNRPDSDEQTGTKFFSGLAQDISAVRRLELRTDDRAVSLVRNGASWTLGNRRNYPADVPEVTRFLQSLVLARRLAPKSSAVELFSRMGLGEDAIHVFLYDDDGAEILSFDYGKRRLRPQAQTSETFVFQEADGRAWTVTGLEEASADPIAWIERTIANISGGRMREVEVERTDGTRFTITRRNPDSDNWLATFPDREARPADDFRAERLSSALNGLELEDLTANSDIPQDALEIARLDFRTFDGIEINVRVVEIAGTSHIQLAANYDEEQIAVGPEEAVPSGAAPPDEEAAALNRLWEGWAYKISSSRLADMLVDAERLAPEEIPVKTPEESQ